MGRVAAVSGATTGAGAADAGQSFDAAHSALVADRSLQFAVETPKPPPPPPDWLKGLFDLLGGLGPVFIVIFWTGLALIVLAILWLIAREVIRIRLPQRHTPTPPGEENWRPAPAQAIALLSDADALAEQDRFAEAVHLILLRSIGDIDGRLPNTVRPALTSRDIAALHRLPDTARPAFNRIARVVEASLFGGRTVSRGDFLECRQAYEAFAFPDAWRAA
ncbi:MAG: DUF4129 domain-containing protein [Brevundimonas sp.]|nr:MAG: DUF4129 domain-containing protein [Brevundimonas sp.]